MGAVDNDGLTTGPALLAWSKVSGPGSVSFSSPLAPVTTASFTAPGTYTLRLTAADGGGMAFDDVTVQAEIAPILTITSGMQTVAYENGGSTANLAATAVDSDGPSGLTASWVEQYRGNLDIAHTVTFDPMTSLMTSATIAFSPAPVTSVTFPMRLQASDGAVFVYKPVQVTVSGGPNQAPVVNAGADLVVQLADAAVMSGSATDDGQPSPLTFTWSKVSGPGNVMFADPSDPLTSVMFDATGDYVLQLTDF